MKKITYTVDSGSITIVGNYWEGAHDRAIILLHMLPATKESWNSLAEAFHKEGYDVLAIDLRGHGESAGGSYENFSDSEHRASQEDVEGARRWLQEQGVIPGNICIGGASIGASLSLEYMGNHPECRAGFCLSAGTMYRGIETLPIVRRLSTSQRVFFVVAKDDTRVSDAFEQTSEIFDNTSADKELRVFDTGGHGTEILEHHPEIALEIVGWVTKDVRI